MGESRGDALRRDIDSIDDELIDLLQERFDVVAALHIWKAQNGFPLFDEKREAEVKSKYIEALGEADGGPIVDAIVGRKHEG